MSASALFEIVGVAIVVVIILSVFGAIGVLAIVARMWNDK